MTLDNVTQILNKIQGDMWKEVMGGDGLDIPWSLLDETQRRYSTNTEKNHACADYLVNCHPEAEWEHLTRALYRRQAFAAAKESKSFMSTGKYRPLISRSLNNIQVATCYTHKLICHAPYILA